MHPAKHVAISTFAALAVTRRRSFPWLAWAASILADADHLAWRVARSGDANPLAAWRYFTSQPKDGPDSHLFLHRYGLIAGLWFAGRRVPGLREIAAGLAFHRAVDDAADAWHFARRRWQQRDRERLRVIVFAREDHRCQGCGKTDAELEMHHRVAEAEGGRNHPDNLLALCHECHDRAHGRVTLGEIVHPDKEQRMD